MGQLGAIQSATSPPLQPPTLHTQYTSKHSLTTNGRNTSTSLQARTNRDRRRQSCFKRNCTCCCHTKGSVHRRFWAFKYTPLSMVLGECNNPTCDGRQYFYSFRVALSQLGFPWAVTAAIGIQSESTGYSIGLNLRAQYIVRYTSPGFATLHGVKHQLITLDEATSSLTKMYQKDPSFINHVNPNGEGYIQVFQHVLLFNGWSSDVLYSILLTNQILGSILK